MPILEVNFTESGSHHVGEGEFAEWSSENYRSYIDLRRIDKGYGETVDFEPVLGREYFLVYVNFDSGDSFGHSSGEHEIIGIFETAEEAYSIREMIEKDAHEKPEFSFEEGGNSLPYKGRNCIYTGTWKGYFESFNACEVVPLRVTR